MATVTAEELEVLSLPFDFAVTQNGDLHGLCVWFTADLGAETVRSWARRNPQTWKNEKLAC